MKLIYRFSNALNDRGYHIVDYYEIVRRNKTSGNKKYKYAVLIIDKENTYATWTCVPKHLRGKKFNEFVDSTIRMFNQQKEWESQPIK